MCGSSHGIIYQRGLAIIKLSCTLLLVEISLYYTLYYVRSSCWCLVSLSFLIIVLCVDFCCARWSGISVPGFIL